MARRFFVENEKIKDDQILIDGQEHIHLSRVLRAQVGEKVLVSSFDGIEFECEIAEIKKDKTTVNILSKRLMPDQQTKITLFQAIIKGERMEWVVEKATELGVYQIVPFFSKFTTVKQSENKQGKLTRVSIEACKQCGRAVPPKIYDVLTFEKALDLLKDFDQILLAYENEQTPLKEILRSFSPQKNTAILVGSEGGFSQEEVKKFTELCAKPVSLGKNILRAETAAVALCSAVLYEFDQFEK